MDRYQLRPLRFLSGAHSYVFDTLFARYVRIHQRGQQDEFWTTSRKYAQSLAARLNERWAGKQRTGHWPALEPARVQGSWQS